MVFKLSRKSKLPLVLEAEEIHYMETLELQGRFNELFEYKQELIDDDGLKEILIEAEDLKELKFLLEAIDNKHQVFINFYKMQIVIQDE